MRYSYEPETPRPRRKLALLFVMVTFVLGAGAGTLLMQSGVATALPLFGGGDPQEAKASAGNEKSSDETQPTVEELAADNQRLRQHLGAALKRIAELEKQSQQAAEASRRAAGKRTLEYWKELNAVMSRESKLREPPSQVSLSNATRIVAGQRDAFRNAAGALRELDSDGVDPAVVAIAEKIADWYDDGVKVSQQARGYLVGSSGGGGSHTWTMRMRQHRQECLDINRRGAALREEMSEKYGLAFPPLE